MKKFEVKKGTHVVIKVEDAYKYLNSKERAELEAYLGMINTGRHQDGKKTNEYYIVNDDEPYAQEVFDIIKKGEQKKDEKVTFYRCGECGFFIQKDYKYCPNCGEEIDWSESK